MSALEKKIVVQKRDSRGIVPAKPSREEEIKRISDLLETLSKRVRQLDAPTISETPST